jgi:hypothetical protein
MFVHGMASQARSLNHVCEPDDDDEFRQQQLPAILDPVCYLHLPSATALRLLAQHARRFKD